MAGNNPRKFKDRIALLNQKQAESTEQFEKVMRDVAAVQKPQQLPFDTGNGSQHLPLSAEALGLPRHHPHFRYGGSLPNVNQIAASGQGLDMQAMSGLPQLPSMPSDGPAYTEAGSPYPSDPVSASPSGGPIRSNRADRRWDTSPYGSDRNYYSSSLVSTYLSPPPEARWRRTHSDSALYQKLQSPTPGDSDQGSPVGAEDIKPSAEQLNDLLQRDLLPKVKEEPGINGLANYSTPQLPPSPHSPISPISPTLHRPHFHSGSASPSFPMPVQSQAALEQEFQRFRLEPPPGGQHHYPDLGQLVGHQDHNTGPTSPHTPTTLPDIYIQDYSQDWAQDCDKGLLDRDFVNTLREGLEPIDDQLMAELTRSTGTFVDPAVEEQFKMNY